LWDLSAQLHEAIDLVLQDDKFLYLSNKFGSRRNPKATRMHFALASIEDAIIQSIERKIQGTIGARINVLMFDGIVLTIPRHELARAGG